MKKRTTPNYRRLKKLNLQAGDILVYKMTQGFNHFEESQLIDMLNRLGKENIGVIITRTDNDVFKMDGYEIVKKP